MASHIRKYLSREIAVVDIFKNPTIYSLALLLESPIKESYDSSIVSIKEEGEGPPLFIIHPGGGLAFCYIGLAHYLSTPIYGINNPKFTDPENGFNSIEEMAASYINLIKTIQKTGPYYLGGWSFGGLIALEMAQQLYRQNETVNRLILIDVDNPKKIDKKSRKGKKLDDEIKEEENFLLKQAIGSDILNLMQHNINSCDGKINKYEISKYDGEVILLRANNNHKSKIKSYGWEDVMKHLKIIDIPGIHSTLFDYEYIQSTAEVIKYALEE